MEKKKIDFKKYLEKIEHRNNTEFLNENIRREVLKIGVEYQLQEGFWIKQVTPFFWTWDLDSKIDRISEEDMKIIISEAKKERNSGNELPLEFQNEADIDMFIDKCNQLTKKKDQLRDRTHKISSSWLTNQKWFQDLENKEKELREMVENDKTINWNQYADDILSSIDPDLREMVNVKAVNMIAGITGLVEEIGSIAERRAFPEDYSDLDDLRKKSIEVSEWLDELYRSHFNVNHEVFLIKSKSEEQKDIAVEGICERELESLLIKTNIPLIKQNWESWCGGGGAHNPPTIYGFEFMNNETGFYCQLNISFIAIMLGFGKSTMDIWWLWPKKYEERLNLLHKIKKKMEDLKIIFPQETIYSLFQKNLIQTRLYGKAFDFPPINKDKWNNETEIDFSQEEIIRTKERFGDIIYDTGKGYYRGPTLNKFYFKREAIEDKTEEVIKEELSEDISGIHMVCTKVYKSQYADEICYCIVFNDYQKKEDEELSWIYNKDFNDILSMLKLFDNAMKQLNYLTHDQIIEKGTIPPQIDITLEIEKGLIEASNEYFLHHERFQLDEESILKEISLRTKFRGTDWSKYITQYKMNKIGKTQEEIALKYHTSQQTISNHINKVEKELVRIARETYVKWLEDKYSILDNVIKIECQKDIGKPYLVIYMKNNIVEVIKIEVSNFKPSMSLYTIPKNDFSTVIEKSKSLEQMGYQVNLSVDFYNLFNRKQYQRKPINYHLTSENITFTY